MKRCPQCEFIYEDDQSLCDMDGVLLVLDARTLPNLHALTTVSHPPPKAHRKNRTVPAFASIVLALVLGMVYYVSTRRPSYTPDIPPLTLSAAPAPIAILTPEPTPEPEPPKEKTKQPIQPIKKLAAKGTPVSTKTTPVSTNTKRIEEPKKEDSKVNSILKKTGRILKKPFKF